MSRFLGPAARTVGLTITLAAVAGAQEKACEINESNPQQIGRAALAVQIASQAQRPADAAKQLLSAVKSLTTSAERMSNQPGRNLVLGRALVLWAMQPDVQLITTRGSLGYATDPEGTIDLAAAIDTAFRFVETSNPECTAETARWRGQKPFIDIVNEAIERLNVDETDAADAAARRAVMLNPHSPYGHVVLANVMAKRNRAAEAFDLYRKGAEVALQDTIYDDIRRQSLIYLGNLAADSAEMITEPAARQPYIDAAKSAFERVLADKDENPMLSTARAGLCRVAIVTEDTASLRQTYKDPLASPASFSYADLMNAGVCMARADMITEATVLFQGAYDKNAHHRDALSNLAIMLLRKDEHARSLPFINRLVSVEPNNPENLQLMVLAYAGVAKLARDTRMAGTATATKTGAKAPPARAPRLSAAAADSIFKIEQAYTDSAVKANERRESLTYRVSLSDFSMSDAKATISGSVRNEGKETKPVVLKVDFLDKDGKVVQSQEETVGPIAPGASARFTVTATPGTSVAAFRYAPIE